MNTDEWGLPVVDSEFITECDDELGEAIDALILANAKATGQQEAICEHYEMLREAIYADTWALVEEIRIQGAAAGGAHLCRRRPMGVRPGQRFPVAGGGRGGGARGGCGERKQEAEDRGRTDGDHERGGRVVNVTHVEDGAEADPVAAVRRLVAAGHEVFVGVLVPKALRREVFRDVHDVLADVVGRAAPKIRRGRAR